MNFYRRTLLSACWLALSVLLGQPVRGAETETDRWLLVFDTSPAMKSLYPTTASVIQHLFLTGADGELKAGDETAVWTYNRQISAQFAPFVWAPGKMTETMTNLGVFLRQQNYAVASSLSVLKTPVSHVVASSRRLTVVIFCDGQSPISGTPYDDGINQAFRDAAGQSKAPKLTVIVLRSQLGKFVGCTLNYPPGAVSYPPFPELPKPPVVTNVTVSKTTATSGLQPSTALQTLEIVGKTVSTNGTQIIPEPAIETTSLKPTNTPPPVISVVVTNQKPAVTPPVIAPSKVAETNPPVATIAPPAPSVVESTPTKPTNSVATNAIAAGTAGGPSPAAAPKRLAYVLFGLAAVVVLGGIGCFFLFRRRPHGSLISSSMQDDQHRR